MRIRQTLYSYPELAAIPEDEWRDFFPNNGRPWTEEDRQYLLEWWCRDDTISLSYALGRTPWALIGEIQRLRRQGILPRVDREGAQGA